MFIARRSVAHRGRSRRKISCSSARWTASSHFKNERLRGSGKKPCCPASISARSSSSRRPRRFSAALITARSSPARDLGKTWERRDNGIGDKEIYSLASQLVDGKPRVYAGHPAGAFVLQRRSRQELDGAAGLRQVPGVEKWTFPGPPHLAHAKSITFHPNDPNIIHVAVEVGGFLQKHGRRQNLDDDRQHQPRCAPRADSNQ